MDGFIVKLPDMHMMDIVYAFHFFDLALYFQKIDIRRRSHHQNISGTLQNRPCFFDDI